MNIVYANLGEFNSYITTITSSSVDSREGFSIRIISIISIINIISIISTTSAQHSHRRRS